MIDMELRVEGATLAARKLQDLAAEIPVIGRLQIYHAVIRMRKRLREAPPRVPSYRRTGTLHRSWEVESTQTGYILSSDAIDPWGTHYSIYVHGDYYGAGQAMIHQGNWPEFKTVVDEEVKNLPSEIEKYIKIEAARLGLT